MIMNRTVSLAAALLASSAMLFCCAPRAFAGSVNGLGISDPELAPNDTFVLTVSVPASENADSASLRAEFDDSAFEVVSWEPVLTNGLSNSTDNAVMLTSANAKRDIDLSEGASFRAVMAVKPEAKSGEYRFVLAKHSFSYVADNGYESIELWEPEITELSVSVSDGVEAVAGAAPVTDDTQTSGGIPESPAPIPRNPHTGVAAAAALPAALAACLLLARKNTAHRKRTRKYMDK